MDDNLSEYINSNLKKGYTKEQIRYTLLQSGYPSNRIDDALSNMDKSDINDDIHRILKISTILFIFGIISSLLTLNVSIEFDIMGLVFYLVGAPFTILIIALFLFWATKVRKLHDNTYKTAVKILFVLYPIGILFYLLNQFLPSFVYGLTSGFAYFSIVLVLLMKFYNIDKNVAVRLITTFVLVSLPFLIIAFLISVSPAIFFMGAG
ncbi:MAG: hypothetical protein ABIJ08_05530 [Nanoarchaeota archaeon]